MAPLQSGGTKLEDVSQVFPDETPLQQFYNKKTIFLTGGTGFFGKIIMEKLLRVTDLQQIYILIRSKKGKDIYTRIEEIFNDPIFAIVKTEKPKFRHKISPIIGDCSQPALGISPEEQVVLKQNVDIVIHAAATVRFDEKLKLAIAINAAGTREMLLLSRGMTKLKACLHVSTAFANCIHRHIDEKFYRVNLSGENACKLGDCLDEQTLDNITPEIIKGYPNTYTFTKALAEDVIRNFGKGLPVAVFRPAIVITTYKEPIEGWIDNMYGPSGIIVGAGAGILRVFCGNVDMAAHVVPVDYAVNALLTSVWDVANNNYDEPPVYNYVPDPENLITWRQYIEVGYTYGINIPITKSIWYPRLTVTPYKLAFTILAFLYHTVPGFLIDAGLFVTGKKPRMLQIYRKVHKFCDVMRYFSSNNWTFSNKSVRQLWTRLSEEDKTLFAFDMKSVDWTCLFEKSFDGLRKYILKEDESTLAEAKRRNKRMMILHYTVVYGIYALGLYLLYWTSLWLCDF